MGEGYKLGIVYLNRRRDLGVTSMQNLTGKGVAAGIAGQFSDEGMVPFQIFQIQARRLIHG